MPANSVKHSIYIGREASYSDITRLSLKLGYLQKCLNYVCIANFLYDIVRMEEFLKAGHAPKILCKSKYIELQGGVGTP